MAAPKMTSAGEMPFLDHLEELRWRIIYSLGGVLAGLVVGAFVAFNGKWDILKVLTAPYRAALPNVPLYFHGIGDAFMLRMNVAMAVAGVLAFPVVLFELWAFLAPGLYDKEKKVAMGVLAGGLVLFLSGAALAYFVVLPLAIPWLMGFNGDFLKPLITADEYFSFMMSLVLTFGASFELPILILALAALGIVTPKFLRKYRRHAIVAIVFIAAFLTPGDLIWTTIALSVPLYALYEISVLLAVIVEKRRNKRRLELLQDD